MKLFAHFRPIFSPPAPTPLADRRSPVLSHPRGLRGQSRPGAYRGSQGLPPGMSPKRGDKERQKNRPGLVDFRRGRGDTRRVRFSPPSNRACGNTSRQYKRSCIYLTPRPLTRNHVTNKSLQVYLESGRHFRPSSFNRNHDPKQDGYGGFPLPSINTLAMHLYTGLLNWLLSDGPGRIVVSIEPR